MESVKRKIINLSIVVCSCVLLLFIFCITAYADNSANKIVYKNFKNVRTGNIYDSLNNAFSDAMSGDQIEMLNKEVRIDEFVILDSKKIIDFNLNNSSLYIYIPQTGDIDLNLNFELYPESSLTIHSGSLYGHVGSNGRVFSLHENSSLTLNDVNGNLHSNAFYDSSYSWNGDSGPFWNTKFIGRSSDTYNTFLKIENGNYNLNAFDFVNNITNVYCNNTKVSITEDGASCFFNCPNVNINDSTFIAKPIHTTQYQKKYYDPIRCKTVTEIHDPEEAYFSYKSNIHISSSMQDYDNTDFVNKVNNTETEGTYIKSDIDYVYSSGSTITGGYFSALIRNVKVAKAGKDPLLTITGGMFAQSPEFISQYVPKGYIAKAISTKEYKTIVIPDENYDYDNAVTDLEVADTISKINSIPSLNSIINNFQQVDEDPGQNIESNNLLSNSKSEELNSNKSVINNKVGKEENYEESSRLDNEEDYANKSISKLVLENQHLVKTARNSYENLNQKQKDAVGVDNLNKLVSAENAISYYKLANESLGSNATDISAATGDYSLLLCLAFLSLLFLGCLITYLKSKIN